MKEEVPGSMRVRPARRDESPLLTEVAREAKASWGYPVSWLDQWAAELTFTPEYIQRHTVLVAEEEEVLGFVALEYGADAVELAHLWVRPAHHGRGVGKALLRAASEHAAGRGAEVLEVVSDPHAAPFYERMGGRRIGWVDAGFEDVDRRLPVLHISVHGPARAPMRPSGERGPSRCDDPRRR
jgi:ribosomal protein S18 acetylase RimI-like enzyme